MKKIMQFSLTNALLLFSFHFCSPAHAQPDNFNYSTTVALILQEQNGGHIFQRPDYDEPRNFFILIYGIVGKYAVHMQPEHAGLTLDISSLPVEETILLINHEAQKLLFLGDHWIGDGEQFSIMETDDYRRLQGYFAETRKHRGEPTPSPFLDVYANQIHKTWADNPDDFYREYYFPDPKPITNTASPATGIPTTNTTADKKFEGTHTDNKTDTSIQSNGKKHEKRIEGKQKAEIIEEGATSFSDNDLTNPPKDQDVQHTPVTIGTEVAAYSKLWLWIFLVATVLAIGYWQRRQIK